MSECEYLLHGPKCDNEATETMYDRPICAKHKEEEEELERYWAEERRKRREELEKNPWNAINHCTRCKMRMPESWGHEDSAKENGIFQSTDGHNAEVLLTGGYAEFVDTMFEPKQVAKLCHQCGHELLEWLNYDYSMDGRADVWVGHPKEPYEFCNGWTYEDL